MRKAVPRMTSGRASVATVMVLYLRVREIFALAADYDPTREDTTTFFQIMQNKLHYAATGLTASQAPRESNSLRRSFLRWNPRSVIKARAPRARSSSFREMTFKMLRMSMRSWGRLSSSRARTFIASR